MSNTTIIQNEGGLPPNSCAGEQQKQAGQTAVLQLTANQEYREKFVAWADNLLRQRGSFTAEEVVSGVGFPPGSTNCIGACMTACKKRLQVSVLGFEKARRKSRRAAAIPRWGRK